MSNMTEKEMLEAVQLAFLTHFTSEIGQSTPDDLLVKIAEIVEYDEANITPDPDRESAIQALRMRIFLFFTDSTFKVTSAQVLTEIAGIVKYEHPNFGE